MTTTINNIKIYELPSYWASALINNDYSGLNEQDQNEVQYWLAENNCLDFVDVSEESYVGRFNGLICDMNTYTAF